MTSTAPAFDDLHLLAVLAETRSYTQAARRLGISKASVSTRIADLERSAGVPLVRRTTRSVGLTEAGKQLVDQTHAAFEQIAQSFAGVRDLAGSPRGVVLEPISSTWPEFCRIITGRTARVHRNAPVKLTSITCCHSSSGSSEVACGSNRAEPGVLPTPALASSRSTRP